VRGRTGRGGASEERMRDDGGVRREEEAGRGDGRGERMRKKVVGGEAQQKYPKVWRIPQI